MRGPRKPRDARRTGTSLDTRRLRLTFPQMVLILFEFSPSFCFSGFFFAGTREDERPENPCLVAGENSLRLALEFFAEDLVGISPPALRRRDVRSSALRKKSINPHARVASNQSRNADHRALPKRFGQLAGDLPSSLRWGS